MARTLDELRAQYNRAPKGEKRGGMPMGPRRGGPMGVRPHGKPKNTRDSVKRLWRYVSAYKGRLFLVLLCMLFSTISSLVGGYMTAPIINRITLAIKPDADLSYSTLELDHLDGKLYVDIARDITHN